MIIEGILADGRQVQNNFGTRIETFEARDDRLKREREAKVRDAAPDLLAVLMGVLDTVDFERGAFKDDKDKAVDLLICARAAIAKATGTA